MRRCGEMPTRFRNRHDAGLRLASFLGQYAHRSDVVVLGLPGGGIPVGAVVAEVLGAPLDVFIVRKLGLPRHEELAMGAIATGGVRVLDPETIRIAGVSERDLAAVTAREMDELRRRERCFRGDRPFPDLSGKTVILVDDGLATGSTMRAAVEALRVRKPARIVVGVPVSAPETCEAFRDLVDEVVCAVTPDPFEAVGLWYEDFSQTTDEEVHEILDRHREPSHATH